MIITYFRRISSKLDLGGGGGIIIGWDEDVPTLEV